MIDDEYPKPYKNVLKPFVSREWLSIDHPLTPFDGTPILGFAYPIAEIPTVCWYEKAPDHWCLPKNKMYQWRYMEKECFETEEKWLEDWMNSFYEPTRWLPLDDPPKF